MQENINTKEYWDGRFSKNDGRSWKTCRGEWQTTLFAHEIAKRLRLSRDFDGTLLDFGCALGDAIPIYARKYPRAKIIGVDFSSAAIETCIKKYGSIATFICGTAGDVPFVDVIVTSNVLEHITGDKAVVVALLKKCSDLYIAVPFDEKLTGDGEHINSYDKESFGEFGAKSMVYLCRGIRFRDKLRSFIDVEVKNTVRPLFGRPIYFGGIYRQILFHLRNREKV